MMMGSSWRGPRASEIEISITTASRLLLLPMRDLGRVASQLKMGRGNGNLAG
jgi:hypothetical protein